MVEQLRELPSSKNSDVNDRLTSAEKLWLGEESWLNDIVNFAMSMSRLSYIKSYESY